MERPLTRGFRGFQLQFATNPLASPGGTIEDHDADPAATLAREAAEEAQLQLDATHTLGWAHDPTGAAYGNTGPCARIRLAARITRVGPANVDPATGRTMIRLLATPRQAAHLLGHGDHGHAQATEAAGAATELWGIPPAPETLPITEVPAVGIRVGEGPAVREVSAS